MWHDDELYVLESQTKSNYWPKDLIQVGTVLSRTVSSFGGTVAWPRLHSGACISTLVRFLRGIPVHMVVSLAHTPQGSYASSRTFFLFYDFPHAEQRNKYEDWVTMALGADYNVVWLPLSDESAGIG